MSKGWLFSSSLLVGCFVHPHHSQETSFKSVPAQSVTSGAQG